MTVFRDASSRTSKVAVEWCKGDCAQWHKRVLTPPNASVQILELSAIHYAFQLFSHELLNIVTDSEYAANVVFHLESLYLLCLDNPLLFRVVNTMAFDKKPTAQLLCATCSFS